MEYGRSWVAHKFGEPEEVLHLEERPIRQPGENQISIRVEACGIAMPDLLMSRGQYPIVSACPLVPGQEAAGTVVAAGPGSRFRPGDRVAGITEHGANTWEGGLAEHAILRDSRSMLIPAGWDAVDAAAFPVAFSTANGAIGRRAPVVPGQTLLVLGASGSTGTALVILGKALGAEVIAVASGQAKMDFCREIGADHVIDYAGPESVSEQAMKLTGGRGVDMMADPVGGAVATDAAKAVAIRGRIVLIGFGSGSFIELTPGDIILRDQRVIGSSDYYSTPEEDRQSYDQLSALAAAGKIKSAVRTVWPFEDGARAIAELRSSVLGKVAVRVG